MTDVKQQRFDDQDPDEREETDDESTGGKTGECVPEGGCEPEPEGQGKGKGKPEKGIKPTTPAKPAAPAAASKHTYPFNVRYAAEFLDLMGFVDGQAYGDAEIKDLLIQNGYTEFADIEPAFHKSEATNTLVITIKGSKKGVCYGR